MSKPGSQTTNSRAPGSTDSWYSSSTSTIAPESQAPESSRSRAGSSSKAASTSQAPDSSRSKYGSWGSTPAPASKAPESSRSRPGGSSKPASTSRAPEATLTKYGNSSKSASASRAPEYSRSRPGSSSKPTSTSRAPESSRSRSGSSSKPGSASRAPESSRSKYGSGGSMSISPSRGPESSHSGHGHGSYASMSARGSRAPGSSQSGYGGSGSMAASRSRAPGSSRRPYDSQPYELDGREIDDYPLNEPMYKSRAYDLDAQDSSRSAYQSRREESSLVPSRSRNNDDNIPAAGDFTGKSKWTMKMYKDLVHLMVKAESFRMELMHDGEWCDCMLEDEINAIMEKIQRLYPELRPLYMEEFKATMRYADFIVQEEAIKDIERLGSFDDELRNETMLPDFFGDFAWGKR